MKTTPLAPGRLRGVFAVPPLARRNKHPAGRLDLEESAEGRKAHMAPAG